MSTDAPCNSSIRITAAHPQPKEKHCLFVLFQHGLWGTMDRFQTLQEVIQREVKQDSRLSGATCHSTFGDTTVVNGSSTPPPVVHDVTLWGTDINSMIFSEQGTVKCAKRLGSELGPTLENWVFSHSRAASKAREHLPGGVSSTISIGPVVSSGVEGIPQEEGGQSDGADGEKNATVVKYYFSCVGHSFGGVILREAMHNLISGSAGSSTILKAANIKLCSFVTLATPHCGVTDRIGNHRGSLMSSVWGWGAKLLGSTLSTTVKDLTLGGDVLSEKHLFSPAYLKSIDQFSRKRFYGNTVGDPAVSFHTSTCLQLSASLVKQNDEKVVEEDKEHREVIREWDSAPRQLEAAARANAVEYPHILPAYHKKSRKNSSPTLSNGDDAVCDTNTVYEVQSAAKLKEQGYPSEICISASAGVLPKYNMNTVPPVQYKLGRIMLESLSNVTVHPVVHHSPPETWMVQYMTHIRVHDCIAGQHCPPLDELQEQETKRKSLYQTTMGSQQEAIVGRIQTEQEKADELSLLAAKGAQVAPKTLQELAGAGMPDVVTHIARHLLSDWLDVCML